MHLRVENTDTMFSSAYRDGQVLRMHIAHGLGQFVADEATLHHLESEKRVVFRYVDARGTIHDAANVNGSMNAIAGIVNDAGNVLGLMPHPERSVEALLGAADGLGIFESLRDAMAGVR
jgi:phosphoribosylformylglycinamidine synthase subunit PurQ / glutaminase